MLLEAKLRELFQKTSKLYGCRVTEFHVAPVVAPKEGGPHHEWLIEFDKEPRIFN